MVEMFPLIAHKTWSGEVLKLSLVLIPHHLWGLGMSVGCDYCPLSVRSWHLGIARDPPSTIHLSHSHSQME